MKKPLRLLVFDCDGVLFDSRLANKEYYNSILKVTGRSPLTEEELEYVHMHSLPECIEFLFRRHPDLKDLAFEIAKKTPYSDFFVYMQMEPGLPEFLEWAYSRVKIALCTNRTTSTLPLLRHFDLEKYFHLIRTALEIPKNDPRALSSILEHFRCSPSNTLYVGDSAVDERLCLACSVPLVSYKNPALKAIKVLKNYEDLKIFLQENFSL
jgi:phosphoglycolate phosphatase-like HAD superfamily hydrolase